MVGCEEGMFVDLVRVFGVKMVFIQRMSGRACDSDWCSICTVEMGVWRRVAER